MANDNATPDPASADTPSQVGADDTSDDQPGDSRRTPRTVLAPLGRIIAPIARFGATLSQPGMFFALVFFCLAQSPSLIPRSWLFQAILGGIALPTGYLFGVLGAWLVRKIGIQVTWQPAQRRKAGIALFILAGLAVPVSLVLGARWQAELRAIFDIQESAPLHTLRVLLLSFAIGAALIVFFRWIGKLVSRLAMFLDKFLPLQLARILSTVAVVVISVLVFNGTVLNGILGAMERSNAKTDLTTDDGVVQPTTPLRSGSAASLAAWESLGRQGRTFVAGGPSVTQLRTFAAASDGVEPDSVKEPIRVYAGLRSADSLESIADLVVDELDRTDAWNREIVAVATTTGTGWIDPSFANALEYMHGGDSAIAAMQYSFLPSWVAFLTAREAPPEAGRILFDAVYERWSQLPEDDRPYLLVFGLSLGSFGAQGAFSGTVDLEQRTDGALFVGTPSFTPLWRQATDGRDQGSLQMSPVLNDGAQVRWATNPNDPNFLWRLGQDWGPQRTVYLQHPSDAVVWWDTSLLWHEPDWIREPATGDRLTNMFWIPIVTFFQVSFDQFVAGSAPAGHGHTYVSEYAAALAPLGGPADWSTADTQRLQEILLSGVTEDSSSLIPGREVTDEPSASAAPGASGEPTESTDPEATAEPTGSGEPGDSPS